jgi:ammonia channel protein AmtB
MRIVLKRSRAALVAGGAMNKVSVGRFLVFIVFWTTLVYDAVARWSWHPAGWSRQRGSMDFAGGTAVHITSGTTVAAFSVFYAFETRGFKTCMKRFFQVWDKRARRTYRFIFCRRSHKENGMEMGQFQRPNHPEPNGSAIDSAVNGGPVPGQHMDPEAQTTDLVDDAPHDVNNMVLGTAMLWIGWFGFNGGSALGGNLRAVSASLSTHVAACSGGTTSLLICWLFNSLTDSIEDKQLSVIAFCDGAIAALVAITPAAGYVSY